MFHLDKYHQRFEDGLEMTTMTKERLDVTKADHWNLYGFNYSAP